MNDMNDIIESDTSRFKISNDGWRRKHAGRDIAHLLREAISNAFDQPDVTKVSVTMGPGRVVIEDDSPTGIPDVNLISTVFMTNKEDTPTSRGRKGAGLKELISVADHAIVETVGYTTTFSTGRVTTKNSRTIGTKVTIECSAWSATQLDQTLAYLSRIISPDNILLTINGVSVSRRKLRSSFRACLETQVVTCGVQRDEYHATTVEIRNLAKGELFGWLYEMGIPIQQISTRFHVNIMQRVPLNDNRDTVNSWWIKSLYSHIVKALLDKLSPGACRQDWVQEGASYISNTEVRTAIVSKVFGADPATLAIEVDNTKVNDIARQHGYTVLPVALLTGPMREILSVVKPAEDVVKHIESNHQCTYVDTNKADPSGQIRGLVAFLGRKLLGVAVGTRFYDSPPGVTTMVRVAQFEPGNTIAFNINPAADLPLQNPIHPRMLSVIIHELAHHYTPEHNKEFNEQVERLGGKMSLIMFEHGDQIRDIITRTTHVKILCQKCGEPRHVAIYNAHQIKYCIPCTKSERRQRAKAARGI